MNVMYLDDLDKMAEQGCSIPGCDHTGHPIFLHAKCHIEARMEVMYSEGLLHVRCGECGKSAMTIVVGKRIGDLDDLTTEERPTLSGIVGYDDPVSDALETLASILLRTNEVRHSLGKPKLLLKDFALQLVAPRLLDDERDLLRQASLTEYDQHAAFMSPEEVRMYFQPSTLELAMEGAAPDIDKDTLARMAEVVIKTRTNCAF